MADRAIYIRLTDDGQHIRKWDRAPFEGAATFYSAKAMGSPISRVEVAEFMERYAERLVAGPAVKEFAHPINRNRHDPEVASAIRAAIYALAQAVRTGVDQPEADWPLPRAAA